MRPWTITVALGLAGATVVAAPVARPRAAGQETSAARQAQPIDVIRQAFHSAYSLDYDEAIALARQSVLMGPNDPQTHRALATVLWLDILFRRGACTVDHYLGGVMKSHGTLPQPAADFEAEFRQELAQSITLAETRLKRNSHDLDARHDAGAAYALQASYAASVDGSIMAAFRSAKRAYDAQAEVLSHDPQRADASFAVGVYRYMVSGLSLPARVVAYLAGFDGGKERGISMVEGVSTDVDTGVDAKAALVLIYTREDRHGDALRILRELEVEFPRNRLFILEEGAAAIRADHAAEAEVALTRGLAAADRDDRPKFPGERALWFYKRGMARVFLNHLTDAQGDLETAQQSDPAGWVQGRIRVEFGKIADLTGRRPDAVAAYRQAKAICSANDDEICEDQANRLIKKPFRLTSVAGERP